MTQLTGAEMLSYVNDAAVNANISFLNDSETNDVELDQAMLEGSYLESGWDTTASGGGADGIFQIQLNAHPGVSAAQAEDPSFAASYMLPSYVAAIQQVGQSFWKSNPAAAAEETVLLAEQPSNYSTEASQLAAGTYPVEYGAETATAVPAAESAAAAAVKAGVNPNSSPSLIGGIVGNLLSSGDPTSKTAIAGVTQGPGAAIGSEISGVGGIVGDVLKALGLTGGLEELGLVVFGAILIIIGLIVTFKDTGVGEVATGASKAAVLA